MSPMSYQGMKRTHHNNIMVYKCDLTLISSHSYCEHDFSSEIEKSLFFLSIIVKAFKRINSEKLSFVIVINIYVLPVININFHINLFSCYFFEIIFNIILKLRRYHQSIAHLCSTTCCMFINI